MTPSTIQAISAALFAVALLHTFSTRFFERLANARPAHAGIWHLLGEVEVVFGFWAMVLILFMFAVEGRDSAIDYLDSRNFTEPMFVFAIMVVAGTKPILQLAMLSVRTVAQLIPLSRGIAFYFATLSLVPLLGSFITEPAAMTLAALILRDNYFSRGISLKLKYTTLGVLFVNISIGGTLTPFAAPPRAYGGGEMGMGYLVHDIHFRLESSYRRDHQCGERHFAVPPRIVPVGVRAEFI